MAPQMSWDDSCRLCSEEKIEMLPIFGEEGIRRRVAQKLRICLPIMVYKTDPLPKQICQYCATKLDDIFEFRESCLNVYKAMHLKLLANRDLNSVKIFLDAMLNSPDPCQVQLCTTKQRAPPPLMPLPLSGSMSPARASDIAQSLEPLPELPCEVEIKEEPMDELKLDHNLRITRENSSTRDDGNEDFIKNGGGNVEKTTSILERVLTGDLTIDHCKNPPETTHTSQWYCLPCNSYYKNKDGLIKHMQLYCPRRSITCGKCFLVFKSVDELMKHEDSDHRNLTLDKPVKECHICDKEFISWEMLKNHISRDHVSEPIAVKGKNWCLLCNRLFPNAELYHHHHKQVHEVGTLNEDSDLEHSENTVGVEKSETREFDVKSLSCPTCGKVCTQQSALSNHMRTHEPKKHKCNICGRSYGLQIRLAAHKLSEHGQHPSVSPVTASVEQEEALNAEREAREARLQRCRTYSEVDEERPSKRAASERSFNCSHCKKSFSEKRQLQRHELSHSRGAASVHNCSVCQKSFADKSLLEAHEKTHVVDRTYQCAKCDKIFFKEHSLMTHQCTGTSRFPKRSTGKSESRETDQSEGKKYKCTKCPAIFSSSQSRNAHVKKHDEQKPQEMEVDEEVNSPVKLAPETPGTSVTAVESRVEAQNNVNSPVPMKRTLIRTTGGYRCGVCQSPFVLRELAVAHLRSAHPVMPYQCPYCKKRFTTQYTFSHHIKTDHLNE